MNSTAAPIFLHRENTLMEEVEAIVEAPRQRKLEITVIVPVYNAGYDLTRCLQSLTIAGQQAIDIILVDDASTDGAAEACAREFGTRYHRFDTGPNGPAKARNLGTTWLGLVTLIIF